MRQSQPKNDGRGWVVGGSWVKSVYAQFDTLKKSFRTSKCPVILVVNKGTLTI